jgi:7-cyano-7-deazaguanine synthase
VGVVTLVSGGVDSTLMALLAKNEGLAQHPLFIDYGQRSAAIEWRTCRRVLHMFGIERPKRMKLSGFGELVPSGLTRQGLRLNEDAFLPGRNLLFVLAGAAYAYGLNAWAVSIGLLSDESHIFPDQTEIFLARAAELIELALGRRVSLIAPLMHMTKAAVLEVARARGIHGTYSCHSGRNDPCGRCVSCREIAEATT